MDDVEPLQPDDVSAREFAHSADGLDEREVRAFLDEVAGVMAAALEREQQLEARVAELEAQVRAMGAQPSAATPDPRAEALFAQLREVPAEPAPRPAKRRRARRTKEPHAEPPAGVPSAPDAPTPPGSPSDGGVDATAAPTVGAPADDEPPAAPEPEPEPDAEPSEDDLLRARRDALLDPLVEEMVRASKRLLQDEQNVLLDAARRARARVDPDRLLPDPNRHRDAWAEVLTSAIDRAYSGGRSGTGRTRKPSSAPERVVNELTASLIAPLRERLTATLATVVAQGPYESPAELHRELASAVSARYREWRSAELETRLGDLLAAAYTRGAYDGSPAGAKLRWVSDPSERCPDCDDNSLEPTIKGQHFPTGQAHPPAHPGCRCLVISLPGDGENDTASI